METNSVDGRRPQRLTTAVVHSPRALLRRGASVYGLFLAVILFNMFAQVHVRTGDTSQPGWVFDQLPNVLSQALSQPVIVTEVLLIFAGQTLLDVTVSQQMMKVFRGQR